MSESGVSNSTPGDFGLVLSKAVQESSNGSKPRSQLLLLCCYFTSTINIKGDGQLT